MSREKRRGQALSKYPVLALRWRFSAPPAVLSEAFIWIPASVDSIPWVFFFKDWLLGFPSFLSFFFFLKVFIGLHGVLVVVPRIFSLPCSMWDLSAVECRIFRRGTQNLVPRPGIKPRPPALGAWTFSH